MTALLAGFMRGFGVILLLALCAYGLILLLGALGGH
jgi:hypothetical protein